MARAAAKLMATAILPKMHLFKWTLTKERYYPLVCAGIAALVCWGFDLDLPPVTPERLLSATVTFGAIASGFVGTSLSILTALGTRVMRKIRKTEYLHVVRGYLGWALASGIILSCVSMGGMWLGVAGWFTMVWCAVLVFCVACLWRLARTMLFIFSDPDNQPEN